MWGTVSSKEQLDDNKNSLITIIATGLNETSNIINTTPEQHNMKSSHDTINTSPIIDELLGKSEKKENELIIPSFLQTRIRK